ncbi:MAG: hypothetical protein IPH39_16235 [Sulfuritalea sp.]|nr:hypothetical protein [Sulfuritalea sp.]
MQLQASIKVGNILPGRNPRGYFDPSEMTALEDSVKSKGVLQGDSGAASDAGGGRRSPPGEAGGRGGEKGVRG